MQLSTKAEVHPDNHTRHNSLFELEIVKLKEEFGTYAFKLLPLIFNKTILLKKKKKNAMHKSTPHNQESKKE